MTIPQTAAAWQSDGLRSAYIPRSATGCRPGENGEVPRGNAELHGALLQSECREQVSF